MKTSIAITLAVLMFALPGRIASQQVNSMRGSEVSAADQAPAERKYQGEMPGAQKIIKRTFKGQPPLIPHTTDNFDEITIADNPCLACHMSGEFNGKKIPKVAASHLLTAAAGAEPALDMTRWQCNSCHVAQVDAKPLVGNTFKTRGR